MTTSTATARVWIGSFSEYNAGRLTGAWFDLEDYSDAGELEAAATAYIEEHSDDPFAAEELNCFDLEGLPINGECSPAEAFAAWEIIESLEEYERDAYEAWAGYVGADYATVDDFRDAYLGEADSEEAYAEQYVAETGMLDGIPDHITAHFDFASYARDLFHSLVSVDRPGGIYVFTR